MTSETMILENLNGSSAIRTEYTGHKTKGTNCCGVHVSDILIHVLDSTHYDLVIFICFH